MSKSYNNLLAENDSLKLQIKQSAESLTKEHGTQTEDLIQSNENILDETTTHNSAGYTIDIESKDNCTQTETDQLVEMDDNNLINYKKLIIKAYICVFNDETVCE